MYASRTAFVALVVLVSVVLLAGCSSLANFGSGDSNMTPERKLASIKLAANLAAKGVFSGMGKEDAKQAATLANTVARDILAATDNGTIDTTILRQLAVDSIGKSGGNSRHKKLIASLVDSIAIIVQDRIDNDQSLTDNTKITATINAIRAAAAGVADASTLYVN